MGKFSSGGGGDGGAAARAEAAERERQRNIQRAVRQINNVFQGRTVGINPVNAHYQYDPDATLYDRRGREFKLEGEPGQVGTGEFVETFGPTGTRLNERGREVPVYGKTRKEVTRDQTLQEFFESQIPEGGLFQDTKIRGGFKDRFFDQRRDAVKDFYSPQLEDQFTQAKKNLTFALANAGLLQSGAAIDEQARLARQNQLGQADINARADAAASDLRERVNSQRQTLISQAQVSADPDLSANLADTAAQNFRLDAPTLSPLAQFFNQAAIGAAPAIQSFRNRQTPGTGSGSSGRNVN